MSRGKLHDIIEANGWPWLLDTLATLADSEADALFRSGLENQLLTIRKLRSIARKLHKASLACETSA